MAAVFDVLAEALHAHYPSGNPYEVPESQRVDADALDPNSVANPDGDDLDWIDPDVGGIVDLQALELDL
jgi:hypothetical protein